MAEDKNQGEKGHPQHHGASARGFASMDAEKQRAIARKGGQSVPDEKRSFSQNRQLAAEAGRKGGQESSGNFAHNRERAAIAGRKGGERRGAERAKQKQSS